jgi:hypothetical protein
MLSGGATAVSCAANVAPASSIASHPSIDLFFMFLGPSP